MTAAERLLQLAGITGTAGALLAAIGTGITAGALLVSRSTLGSATAAAHLLDAGVPVEEEADTEFRGFGPIPLRSSNLRRRREEEGAMLCGMC